MNNFRILTVMVFLLKITTQTHTPQVYEDIEDLTALDSMTRVVRHPLQSTNDMKKYYQILPFDFRKNIQQDPRRTRYAQQQQSDLKTILTRRRLIDDEASKSKNETLYWNHRNSRRRQDNDEKKIIYIHPESEVALHNLIGKNPNLQLEGLKKLLLAESAQSNLILPPIKGPIKPITEQIIDVPANNPLPNSEALHQLQAQLDAMAKAQTADVLAKAQQEALAHVEAQHRAIAQAQEDAQRRALAQIEAHQQHPLSLPLTAEIAPNQEILKTQALKEARQQVEQALQRAHLEKISITKTQSIQHPNMVEVLETQHQIYPTAIEPHEDQQQYAARYAFGYRIKDVKMGNDFGHEERRDGKSAQGQYHVLLPDGRMQRVEYYADPSGYHAKVTYENVAHH